MTHGPDRLSDLPPSAKLVLKVLEVDGPMTQKRLAAETRLSKRTVRHALANLREADALEERISFRDARKTVYSLADPVGASSPPTGDDRVSET